MEPRDAVLQPVFLPPAPPIQTRVSTCPQTVLLTGIPDVMEWETLQDLLEIHFQKNGNGGGEIEAFLYNPVGQKASALFGDASGDGGHQ